MVSEPALHSISTLSTGGRTTAYTFNIPAAHEDAGWVQCNSASCDEGTTPALQAQCLLETIRSNPHLKTNWVLYQDVLEEYERICGQMGLTRFPWNAIAREFRKLTGGTRKQCYIWERDHRVRKTVYFIPPRPPSKH